MSIRGKRDGFFIFLVSLLVFILEAFVFILLTYDGIEIRKALFIHFGIALVSLICVFYFRSRDQDISIPSLLTLLTLVSGPFGAFIALSCSRLFPVKNKDKSHTWLYTAGLQGDNNEIYERIRFGLDDLPEKMEVEPYINVIRYGSIEDKLAILSKVARYFNPSFVSLLKEALDSEHNAVRVQAAAIIARIDDDYNKRCKNLEKENSNEDIDDLKNKILVFEEYLDLDIADEQRRAVIVGKIEKFYETLIEKDQGDNDKGDNDLLVKLAKIYMERQNYEKALQIVSIITSDSDVKSENLLACMDILIKQCKFREIRELCDRIPGNSLAGSDEDQSLLQVLSFLSYTRGDARI